MRSTNLGKTDISTMIQGEKVVYDQKEVLNYSASRPLLSLERPAAGLRRINRYYFEQVQRFIQYCETVLRPEAIGEAKAGGVNSLFLHYEAIWTYDVTYNQNYIVSIYVDQYTFAGGAHGSTTRSSATWSVSKGKKLELADLFPRSNRFESDIKNQIVRQIDNRIATGDDSFFEEYATLVGKTFQPDQFYLNNQGVVIYFQQYDIAPYASGIPTFIIPYAN